MQETLICIFISKSVVKVASLPLSCLEIYYHKNYFYMKVRNANKFICKNKDNVKTSGAAVLVLNRNTYFILVRRYQ